MQISVVIPVYNAARFLTESVDSVLAQPEVREVLLVDDGSKDQSLALCQALASQFPDVIKVFQHPGGANRGAAATRNVGMVSAQFEYIAFLDADDVYLPKRFEKTLSIFKEHPDADGVYETVISVVYDQPGQTVIDERAGKVKAGFDEIIAPEELFDALAFAKTGYIHLNGLVIKKSSVTPSLLFDTSLRPCEDTDMLLRWAASCRLVGGAPDRIVAHRRVHDANTVFDTRQAVNCRYHMLYKCATNSFYGSRNKKANRAILQRMARATKMIALMRRMHIPVTPFRWMITTAFLLRHPRLVRHII